MTEIAVTPEAASPPQRTDFKRLMVFFALVYLVEGIGQSDGLISQPSIIISSRSINGHPSRSPPF